MKFDIDWSDDLEIHSFSKAFLIWSIVLGFHFCLYNKESEISLYVLFGVSCLIVSTVFLNDIVISPWKRKVFSILVGVFSTIGYGAYTVLSTPITLLSQTYLLFCLFFALLLSPPKIFPFFIILGNFLGAGLFFIDQNTTSFDWQRLSIIGVDSLMIFLMWGFIYRQRHLAVEEKEKKLKEMAVGLNHELSSYLTGLRLYISFFKRSPHYSKDLSKVKTIEASLAKMTLFIETLQGNFRDYFPKDDLQPLDVKTSVNEGIDTSSIPEDIRENILISGDSFFILIDEVVFRHILYNLLRNAIHFMEKAGKGHISIYFSRHSDFNQMVFEDTGYGIKEEYLPYVFDKFFSRRRHGTGMGLYFCKTALEAYGASIFCEAEPYHYTRFTLRFSTRTPQ